MVSPQWQRSLGTQINLVSIGVSNGLGKHWAEVAHSEVIPFGVVWL